MICLSVGNIKSIYKNKGSMLDAENYRNITILSCMEKLFTACLHEILSKFINTHRILENNQAAYRNGFSVADHLFALHALIELCKFEKENILCICGVRIGI